MDKESMFKAITKQMLALYLLKNKNYGDSFHKTYEDYGMIMPCIRLEDKLQRLKSLVKQGDKANVDDESIRDTLIDLANYSVMTVMELDREANKSKEIE
jgi:hypothetical protein